jgi:hypothetical protein
MSRKKDEKWQKMVKAAQVWKWQAEWQWWVAVVGSVGKRGSRRFEQYQIECVAVCVEVAVSSVSISPIKKTSKTPISYKKNTPLLWKTPQKHHFWPQNTDFPIKNPIFPMKNVRIRRQKLDEPLEARHAALDNADNLLEARIVFLQLPLDISDK